MDNSLVKKKIKSSRFPSNNNKPLTDYAPTWMVSYGVSATIHLPSTRREPTFRFPHTRCTLNPCHCFLPSMRGHTASNIAFVTSPHHSNTTKIGKHSLCASTCRRNEITISSVVDPSLAAWHKGVCAMCVVSVCGVRNIKPVQAAAIYPNIEVYTRYITSPKTKWKHDRIFWRYGWGISETKPSKRKLKEKFCFSHTESRLHS